MAESFSYKENSYYAAVEANGEYSQENVIPDGETWEIQSFEGNGAYLDDAHVCLVWDYGGVDTIVRATHGDTALTLAFKCVGNGVKKLAIVLINDTAAERVLGASWKGRTV